jgi:hypothetical protein
VGQLPIQQPEGDPGEDSGAVSGAVGRLRPAVVEVVEALESQPGDPVAAPAMPIGDEADTTRIVVLGRRGSPGSMPPEGSGLPFDVRHVDPRIRVWQCRRRLRHVRRPGNDPELAYAARPCR